MFDGDVESQNEPDHANVVMPRDVRAVDSVQVNRFERRVA